MAPCSEHNAEEPKTTAPFHGAVLANLFSFKKLSSFHLSSDQTLSTINECNINSIYAVNPPPEDILSRKKNIILMATCPKA